MRSGNAEKDWGLTLANEFEAVDTLLTEMRNALQPLIPEDPNFIKFIRLIHNFNMMDSDESFNRIEEILKVFEILHSAHRNLMAIKRWMLMVDVIFSSMFVRKTTPYATIVFDVINLNHARVKGLLSAAFIIYRDNEIDLNSFINTGRFILQCHNENLRSEHCDILEPGSVAIIRREIFEHHAAASV